MTEREKLWREYARLLTKEHDTLMGFAWVHGWKCPDGVYQRGVELREQLGLEDDWWKGDSLGFDNFCDQCGAGVFVGADDCWVCSKGCAAPRSPASTETTFSDHPGIDGLRMLVNGEPARSRKVTDPEGNVRLVLDPEGEFHHDLGSELVEECMKICRLPVGHVGECEFTSKEEEEPPQPIGFPVPEDERCGEPALALSPVEAMLQDHERQIKDLRARVRDLEAGSDLSGRHPGDRPTQEQINEMADMILAGASPKQVFDRMAEVADRAVEAAGPVRVDTSGTLDAKDEVVRQQVKDLEVRLDQLVEDVDRRLRGLGC